MADEKGGKRPIIIKKVLKRPALRQRAFPHYVTAMMAFFLLVWLLAVASPQARQGVVDYFQHRPQVSRSEGNGQQQAEMLRELKVELEQVIAQEPRLARFKEQLKVEIADGGLRVQVLDSGASPNRLPGTP